MKEFELKSSLLDRERKLILAKDYVDYENKDLKNDLFTRVPKADIVDVKHEVDRIVWYEFSVGYKYSISFLDKDNRTLKVLFKDYFGLRSNYRHAYSDIMNTIWDYYFADIVDMELDRFYGNADLNFRDLKVRQDGIEFTNKNLILSWDKVDVKEYFGYFAVYEKDNSENHKRYSFNEWNSEKLLSIIKTIKKERGS